jgi:GTPase SAR1 family protein
MDDLMEDDFEQTMKVIVVGNGRVGKTSTLHATIIIHLLIIYTVINQVLCDNLQQVDTMKTINKQSV